MFDDQGGYCRVCHQQWFTVSGKKSRGKYCSNACRQKAYRTRHHATRTAKKVHAENIAYAQWLAKQGRI